MAFKMAGSEQPWRVQGPSGPVTIVAVVLQGDEAVLDNGALHARSQAEVGVRFSQDPAGRGKGEPVRIVWIATSDERFTGVSSVELWIDRASGTGWKNTVDQVNSMSHAVRGTIDGKDLTAGQKKSLATLLAKLEPGMWEKSVELKKALEG
jgi:hypothetical protein